jgi:predicted transcriptional regulator
MKKQPEMPRKQGPRFTDTEREGIKEQVALMDRQGYRQTQIAEKVGVAQAMVSMYLKQIRAEYRNRQMQHMQEAVQEKLEQYADIRREAWEAYYKSKEDTEKAVEKFYPMQIPDQPTGESKEDAEYYLLSKPPTKLSESMRRIEYIRTTEGRLPANEYLSTILATHKAECALLGLDKQPVTPQQNTTINLNLLSLLEAARDDVASVNGHARQVPALLAADQQPLPLSQSQELEEEEEEDDE